MNTTKGSFSVHAATMAAAAWTDDGGKENTARQIMKPGSCLEGGRLPYTKS